MPHIAIVDQQMSAGGVERFLHGLVAGFLRQPDAADWRFDLLLWPTTSGRSSTRWPDHLQAANVRLWSFDQVLSRHPISLLFARWRLWERLPTGWVRVRLRNLLVRFVIEQWVAEQKYDLAYFSYPYGISCPKLAVPMVSTPHDFNYKKPFTSMSASARHMVERQMPTWMERCHTLVVSSNFIAAEVAQYYPVAAAKTRVVSLGIPDAKMSLGPADVETLRERLKLPPRFLLNVGWLVPHKNQMVLFEALRTLRDQGIDLPLVSVGPNSHELHPDATPVPDSYVAQVVRRAGELGLAHGRDYLGLGYIRDEELEALYRSTALLVMPTLYEAGGSFPIREALRLGCPVAASRISALEEEHARVNGAFALFDPHDSRDLAHTIAALLKAPAPDAEATRRTQQHMTQIFNWEQTARGYLDVFRQAIG